WTSSYVLMNGSIIAALGLSLYAADLLSDPQLFLIIAGSRLGAAGIVVLIGALEYVADRRYTLRRATSLGLLTFVVTHSVYLPATLLGYGLLTVAKLQPPPFPAFAFPRGGVVVAFSAFAETLTRTLGAVPVLLLAVGLLVVSLHVFNTILDRIETDRLRRVTRHALQRPWVGLLLGGLVTAATTSVAFSLGVVVPLYNRGFVSRRHIIPYILGANLGTLSDTVVVGMVLETETGAAIVLALLGTAGLVSLLAVARFETYYDWIAVLHDAIVGDRRMFYAALVLLLVVPLGLMMIR
ncbi:MAG: sodium:phosphate symporter, partial [Halobacteriales archaeon]|nr:sodium:phosphate symporter [Halobacteriales archaeon]